MTTENTFDPRHSHEPEIPPALDDEGRCLVCCILVERDEARADAKRMYVALSAIDEMRPEDYTGGQQHLTPAFREPNTLEAMRFVIRTVNGVLHGTDEYGEPLRAPEDEDQA